MSGYAYSSRDVNYIDKFLGANLLENVFIKHNTFTPPDQIIDEIGRNDLELHNSLMNMNWHRATERVSFFYTSKKSRRGYIFTSVCLCVCLSVRLSVSTLAGEPLDQF